MFSGLISSIRQFVEAWRSLRALSQLEARWSEVIFYAESNADWAHLSAIIAALNLNYNQPVTCVTSDPADSILQEKNELRKSFYIGSGSARTIFFQTVKATAFVITLTDLNTYYLKRSANNVHYFYAFHALMSTHGAYREHAFDSYDSIFCVGPYQVEEIRLTEKVYGLKAKNLIQAGYCRLDKIMAAAGKANAATASADAVVLLAPTWGDSSLVNNGLETVIKTLVDGRIKTILRLHPMTLRHYPELPQKLLAEFAASGLFTFDSHLQSIDSLLQADIVVADQGGSAIEFALGIERPVVYVKTPAKLHNFQRDLIKLPLFEEQIRMQTGKVLTMESLSELPETIRTLHRSAGEWRDKLAKVRTENVFNAGKSAQVMADSIHAFLTESRKGN